MTRQAVEESPRLNRRQPLLAGTGEGERQYQHQEHRRVGEVAGGTAAECAAVFCCCPCALMNMLVLAVYTVPTGLWKKAWRKKKRKRMLKQKKKALLAQQQQQQPATGGAMSKTAQGGKIVSSDDSDSDDAVGVGTEEDKDEMMEKEMWDHFYGGGFWRSPSRRDDN